MRTLSFLVGLTSLIVSSAAVAQPGPGAGRPCAAASAASDHPGAANCTGPGQGMRGGMGPRARWGRDFTPGWGMMSREEQQQHRDKMLSFTDYEQCRVYMEQHHGQMADRAKERGRTMPDKPQRDACAGLKAPAPKSK